MLTCLGTFSSLTELKLENVNFQFPIHSDKLLALLKQVGSGLEILSVMTTKCIEMEVLDYLITKCSKLKILRLGNLKDPNATAGVVCDRFKMTNIHHAAIWIKKANDRDLKVTYCNRKLSYDMVSKASTPVVNRRFVLIQQQ
ncbi:hypothetical protein HDE_12721 [Halotydeus destructor]|nr:hypothetical protein HDE_12721 [Halotydeus destructor]